jgi:hypothetical protein
MRRSDGLITVSSQTAPNPALTYIKSIYGKFDVHEAEER